MSDDQRTAKQRTSAEEAQRLLLEAVIHLAASVPFPEITARRIAQEVRMDPNVIFRNFETLENLFLAALRVIERRAVDRLEASSPIGIMPINEVFLWVKFAAWLSLSGIDPTRLSIDPVFLERFQRESLRALKVDEAASERGKSAALAIALSYLQAQVLLTPTQPEIFTAKVMSDSLALLGVLFTRLEELSTELGWH